MFIVGENVAPTFKEGWSGVYGKMSEGGKGCMKRMRGKAVQK